MKNLWIYYAIGIAIWTIGVWYSPGDFTSPRTYVPTIFVLGVLLLNLYFCIGEYKPREYEIEEHIYEYVERNTYYLVMAITIFLLVSTNQSLDLLAGESANTIIGSQAGAVLLCILVLALIWMPTDDPKGIVHLRHIKTILYTFAIGTFLIGPIVVLTNLLQ